MALVVICGQACSGKSKAALCLAEALKESGSNQIVRVIDETSFNLDRNESYANVPAEKHLRGVLGSEVNRSVSKDSIIIVDSLNSIKGYRYELWCLARAAMLMKPIVENGTKSAWRREKLLINDEIFEDLVRRFETQEIDL